MEVGHSLCGNFTQNPGKGTTRVVDPPIQSLKLSRGKQSSCSSCCSFEAWVPSLLSVLFVCTMEAWMQQILFKERGTAAAANSALISLTGPLPAPQRGRHFDVWRCEGRALSPHGLQLILSGSRAGVHLRARQGTFLWQFSFSYARWVAQGSLHTCQPRCLSRILPAPQEGLR